MPLDYSINPTDCSLSQSLSDGDKTSRAYRDCCHAMLIIENYFRIISDACTNFSQANQHELVFSVSKTSKATSQELE